MRIPTRTAATAVLLLALAACNTETTTHDVATAGGKPKTSAADSKLNTKEKLRKYAKCLRDNGVDMPDPDANGNIVQEGQAPASRLTSLDSKEAKAFDKCREYEPQGGDLPKPKPEDLARMRKFAKCMRDNGVANFPDPGNSMGLTIGKDGSGESIDPTSPTFEKAAKACEKFSARGGPGLTVGAAR